MVVFLFSNLFPPVKTGSALYTADLALWLSSLVDKVVIFTVKKGDIPPEIAEKKNIHVIYLKAFTLPKLKIFLNFDACSFTLFPSNIKKVKEAIKQHGCDIIHQQSHIFDTSILSYIVSRIHKIPRAITIHTIMAHPNRLFHYILWLVEILFLRPFIEKKPLHVISPDNMIKEYLIKRHLRKSGIWIPYGIKQEDLSHHPTNDSLLKSFNLTNKKIILSLGNITAQRNRKDLFEAFSHIATEYPDAHLVIIGDIYFKEVFTYITKYNINDKVTFLGKQSWNEILKWAQVSLFEAHWLANFVSPGLATLEMMGLGLPVISACNDSSYPENVMSSGKNYEKVTAGDISSIIHSLKNLLDNKEHRETLGKNAKTTIKEHFAWPTIAKQMYTYYQEIIKNYRSS